MAYLIMGSYQKWRKPDENLPSGYQLLQKWAVLRNMFSTLNGGQLFANYQRHGTKDLSWLFTPSKPNAEFTIIERAIACAGFASGVRSGFPSIGIFFLASRDSTAL